MKEKTILLTLLSLISFCSKAQISSLIAGVSVSKMQVEYTFNGTQYSYQDNYSSRVGYHFGLLYERPFQNNRVKDISFFRQMTWEAGLVITTKGYLQDISDFYVGEDPNTTRDEFIDVIEKVKLTYLHVPLSIKYNFKNPNIYLLYGGALDIGLKGKISYFTEADENRQEYSLNVTWSNAPIGQKDLWGTVADNPAILYEGDQIKRFDVGLLLGAGTTQDIATINVRYVLGLSNISATNSYQALVRNQVLLISVISNLNQFSGS